MKIVVCPYPSIPWQFQTLFRFMIRVVHSWVKLKQAFGML